MGDDLHVEWRVRHAPGFHQQFERRQVRHGEAFNITNTPRFAPPNQSFGNALFGQVTSQSNQPRVIQFGLKMLW